MEELHTFKAGALLPAAQAFLSGVFFSLVVAGVVWWTGTQKPGVFLLLGGSSVAFVVWWFLLRHWVNLVNFQAGFQEEPAVQVLEPSQAFQPSLRVELLEREGGSLNGQYIDLPATEQQLKLLASGVVSGGSLSESGWCGSGRPFSKGQFHQLRDALVERGWLAWKDVNAPAQGITVTSVGRRVFTYISEGTHYPTREPDTW